MKEIVCLSFGNCGNSVSSDFWRVICEEHGIGRNGQVTDDRKSVARGVLDVYFASAISGRFVPRSIFIDLDSDSLNRVRRSGNGRLFRPSNYISLPFSGRNNYARGFNEAAELGSSAIAELIRKETERCDRIQGFQAVSAIGGGCGGGLATLVLSNLREDYPRSPVVTHSFVPSKSISEMILEPVNAALAYCNLALAPDLVFNFDNEALGRQCRRWLDCREPKNRDLNQLAAKTIAASTASFRFPGMVNCDLQKLANNLVPFRCSNFVVQSIAPILKTNERTIKYGMRAMVQDLTSPTNLMVSCDSRHGKCVAAAALFRGNFSMSEFEREMRRIYNVSGSQHSRTSPLLQLVALCKNPCPKNYPSACYVSNHTTICRLWERLAMDFDQILEKKAFLHHYIAEGMEHTQLLEAKEIMKRMIENYENIDREWSRIADEVTTPKKIPNKFARLRDIGVQGSAFE